MFKVLCTIGLYILLIFLSSIIILGSSFFLTDSIEIKKWLMMVAIVISSLVTHYITRKW